MTPADKRRRAEEYAWELSQWHVLPVADFVSKIADSLVCYGAELEAAAIEECEKVARRLETLKNETEEAHYRYAQTPFDMRAFGFIPDCVKLSGQIADAIAKLREGKC